MFTGRFSFFALIALMFVLVASPVMAGTVSQGFQENGVTFDHMEVFVFTPGVFTGPAMSGFTNTSWSNINNNAEWAEASGDKLSDLSFYLNFEYTELPAIIHFYSFLGGVMNGDSAQFTFPASGGVVLDQSPLADGQYALDVAAATEAPEPGTLLMFFGGFALVGIGKLRRRRAQK